MALSAHVHERFGGADILVNSAVVARGGSFEEQTPEYWEYSAQGNMVGLFAMCKAFVPTMVKRQRGSIINISSIYGVVANDPSLYEGTDMKQPPDYTFVKAGMINFTRYLANYFGRQGVRANCICPGTVETPSLGQRIEDAGPDVDNQRQAFIDRQPMGRLGQPAEIAGLAVYLASDNAEFLTGQAIAIDGGFTI